MDENIETRFIQTKLET